MFVIPTPLNKNDLLQPCTHASIADICLSACLLKILFHLPLKFKIEDDYPVDDFYKPVIGLNYNYLDNGRPGLLHTYERHFGNTHRDSPIFLSRLILDDFGDMLPKIVYLGTLHSTFLKKDRRHTTGASLIEDFFTFFGKNYLDNTALAKENRENLCQTTDVSFDLLSGTVDTEWEKNPITLQRCFESLSITYLRVIKSFFLSMEISGVTFNKAVFK